VQLYAQPFVATGAYDRYLEVVDPTARQFDDRYQVLDDELLEEAGGFAVDRGGDGTIDYRFGRPDFNVRELSWNLVGRWEYSPGSTLFAIWSHRRGSFADQGVWQLGDDLSELATAPGEHVIMLKLTYWVGS
jgi:hypothetical protein